MKHKFKSECPICHKKVGNRWIARHIAEHKKAPAIETKETLSAVDSYKKLLEDVENAKLDLEIERASLSNRIKDIDSLLNPQPLWEATAPAIKAERK